MKKKPFITDNSREAKSAETQNLRAKTIRIENEEKQTKHRETREPMINFNAPPRGTIDDSILRRPNTEQQDGPGQEAGADVSYRCPRPVFPVDRKMQSVNSC